MKNNIIPYVNILLMLVFAALAILTPVYQFQTMTNLLAVFGLWFISALLIDRQWLIGNTSFFLILGGIIILDFIVGVSNNDYFATIDGINKMPIYCWVFFYLFYIYNVYRPKFIVYAILLLFLISCYFTITGNIALPGASRLLASSMDTFVEERSIIRTMNVGGYDFIYALVFLTLPLLLWCKNNIMRTLVCYSLLSIFVVTVVLGAYMIGILLMVTLFALSFVDFKKIHLSRIIIILIVCFLLKDFFLEILSNVGDQYKIAALARHAEEIESGSYGDGDKYNNRWFIYLGALQNWLQSPIFGHLLGKPVELERSGHSELLGYLEKYGIFCLIYIAYFKTYYQRVKSSYLTLQAQNAFVLLFAVFIVFGFIDRFDKFCGIGFMQFFFAPFLLLLMDRELSNNEGK